MECVGSQFRRAKLNTSTCVLWISDRILFCRLIWALWIICPSNLADKYTICLQRWYAPISWTVRRSDWWRRHPAHTVHNKELYVILNANDQNLYSTHTLSPAWQTGSKRSRSRKRSGSETLQLTQHVPQPICIPSESVGPRDASCTYLSSC